MNTEVGIIILCNPPSPSLFREGTHTTFLAIVSIFHNIQAMYSYIRGDILHIDGITLSVLAEGTGIGFDILVSPTVLGGLLGKEKITLWMHHHITEAGQTLFGFDSVSERSLFRQLLKVNGIGGKTALALLGLGEEELLRAIQFEDDTLLSSVP